MKKLLVACALVASVIVGLGGMARLTWADGGVCSESAPPEVLEAAGCGETGRVEKVAHGLIKVAINIMQVVAVGVMIYGGITFIISQGDSGKATKARHIIIYGLVGLVVTSMAYAILAFVIDEVL